MVSLPSVAAAVKSSSPTILHTHIRFWSTTIVYLPSRYFSYRLCAVLALLSLHFVLFFSFWYLCPINRHHSSIPYHTGAKLFTGLTCHADVCMVCKRCYITATLIINSIIWIFIQTIHHHITSHHITCSKLNNFERCYALKSSSIFIFRSVVWFFSFSRFFLLLGNIISMANVLTPTSTHIAILNRFYIFLVSFL